MHVKHPFHAGQRVRIKQAEPTVIKHRADSSALDSEVSINTTHCIGTIDYNVDGEWLMVTVKHGFLQVQEAHHFSALESIPPAK